MPVTASDRVSRSVQETRRVLLSPGNFYGSLYVQEGPTRASAACVIQIGNNAPIQIARGMTITNIAKVDAIAGVFGSWDAGAGFVQLIAGVAVE